MAENKCEVSRLKTGDRLSRTSYMEVLGTSMGKINVKNQAGVDWFIDAHIVAKECYTAHQYDEEIRMTRTELIELFSKVGDKIFTVNFLKQAKVEDVFDAICNKGKLISNKETKKLLKEGMAGEPRTLIGYSLETETGMGRTLVVDLEAEGHNVRQIDHRTINWLIVGNKKYIEKNYKEPKPTKV